MLTALFERICLRASPRWICNIVATFNFISLCFCSTFTMYFDQLHLVKQCYISLISTQQQKNKSAHLLDGNRKQTETHFVNYANSKAADKMSISFVQVLTSCSLLECRIGSNWNFGAIIRSISAGSCKGIALIRPSTFIHFSTVTPFLEPFDTAFPTLASEQTTPVFCSSSEETAVGQKWPISSGGNASCGCPPVVQSWKTAHYGLPVLLTESQVLHRLSLI